MKRLFVFLALVLPTANASEWFCSRLAAQLQTGIDAPIAVIGHGIALDYHATRLELSRYVDIDQPVFDSTVTPIYLAQHFTHPHHVLVSLWLHIPSQRWCAFLTMSDVI